MTHEKTRAIIVDLDGTLCDTSHRQHLVEAKKWGAFYDALSADPVNSWCRQLIRGMGKLYYATILVSGRPESHRKQTEAWLDVHGFDPHELLMRKTGDYRKDSIVKEEIYREDIEPYHEILFCVDDRKQVVDMWRSLGLTCLQCAEGNF